MRVPKGEFEALPLEVHAVLRGVPMRDVTAVDLPGTGGARTVGAVHDADGPISSSRIRAALKQGDCATATRLLTRPEGVTQIMT